jgi:hypothetical protein
VKSDTRIIFARDDSGLWHRTRATYPSGAETNCGQKIHATLFSTMPDAEELRARVCLHCVKPERELLSG